MIPPLTGAATRPSRTRESRVCLELGIPVVFGFRDSVPGYQMDGYIRASGFDPYVFAAGPNKYDTFLVFLLSRKLQQGSIPSLTYSFSCFPYLCLLTSKSDESHSSGSYSRGRVYLFSSNWVNKPLSFQFCGLTTSLLWSIQRSQVLSSPCLGRG